VTCNSLSEPAFVDLAKTGGFTLTLLDNPWSWRHRAIETIELDSSTDVRATTAVQMELADDLLSGFPAVGEAENARVILPVTSRPKRPLLGFDLETSHNEPAYLLARDSIASFQAAFVHALVEGGLPRFKAVLSTELVEAISLHMPSHFDFFYRKHKQHYAEAIAAYLRSASTRTGSSGPALDISKRQISKWLKTTKETGAILARCLREDPDEFSSAENILLAIPRLAQLPSDEGAVEKLILDYHEAIVAAHNAGEENILVNLAEYGRRFDLLVDVTVPLRRPFEIIVREDRPLTVRLGGRLKQEVSASDARSVHIQVSSRDTTIRLRQPRVETIQGKESEFGLFEAIRTTADVVAIYSSQPERPSRVRVSVPLRLSRPVRWTNFITVVFTLSAVAATLVLKKPTGATADDATRLAVLTLPATVAGALILVREQSGLATRLSRNSRVALGLALSALWICLLYRVVVRDSPVVSTHHLGSIASATGHHVVNGLRSARKWLS